VDTACVTLTQPTLLVVDSIVSPTCPGGWNVCCNGGTNGCVYVYASGGTPFLGGVYYHNWTNFGVADTNLFFICGLSVNTWDVTITDSQGCTVSDSLLLTEPEKVVTTIDTVRNVPCYNDSTGGFTLITVGGTPPYQYSLNCTGPYQSSPTFGGLPIGTYKVCIRDQNGCEDSLNVTIGQPPGSLNAEIVTIKNTNCKSDSTGSITVRGLLGTPPYLYSLDTSGTFGPSGTFTGLRAGNHFITVRGSNYCEYVLPFTISEAGIWCSSDVPTEGYCFQDASGCLGVCPGGGTARYA
jgi:hypothetical protein